MNPILKAYQHPSAGFTLSLPEGWETATDVAGVALIAVAPDRGAGWFRTNLVVTLEQLATPDLATWQEEALALMRYGLNEFLLVDVEEVEVAGYRARRLVAHHRPETDGQAASVTMEQWTLVVGRLGYTLTASMASLDYPELADMFTAMVTDFRPDPEFGQ